MRLLNTLPPMPMETLLCSPKAMERASHERRGHTLTLAEESPQREAFSHGVLCRGRGKRCRMGSQCGVNLAVSAEPV